MKAPTLWITNTTILFKTFVNVDKNFLQIFNAGLVINNCFIALTMSRPVDKNDANPENALRRKVNKHILCFYKIHFLNIFLDKDK